MGCKLLEPRDNISDNISVIGEKKKECRRECLRKVIEGHRLAGVKKASNIPPFRFVCLSESCLSHFVTWELRFWCLRSQNLEAP